MKIDNKILIVEDNLINKKTLTEILKEDFEILQAENGNIAIDIIQREKNNIKLIILDIAIPEKNGLEVLEEIKLDLELIDIPVVAVISIDDTINAIRALDMGAIDIITKPLDSQIVKQRIKNLYELSQFNKIKAENKALKKQSDILTNLRNKEKKTLEATLELKYKAEYDLLTGIYNRQKFNEVTEELIKNNPEEEYYIVILNIQKFRIINDILGLEVGNLILINIAKYISSMVGMGGTYGRLEADHFVFCIPKNSFIPEKMLTNISKAIGTDELEYKVNICFGIYEVEDRKLSVSLMCDRAKLAMSLIDFNYGEKYVFFQENILEDIIQEKIMVKQIDDAIKNEQFEVYLQPIYSISTKEVVSAEALVRWNHPEKGILMPKDFINIFEQYGIIDKLDFYVWEKVCQFINRQIKAHNRILPISVNTSRKTWFNSNLYKRVIDLTKKYNIKPSLLCFEIKVSVFSDEPYQILKYIKELQDYGFKIYLDNFGSSYSSLNMLRDISIDILKIDIAFLSSIETSKRTGSILTSIIRMAKWLDIPVIVEGVETKYQIDFLQSVGCDLIQGYYFSKPVTLDNFDQICNSILDISMLPVGFIPLDKEFDMLFEGNSIVNRVLNNVVGGIGFYNYSKGKLEAIRVNDSYYEIMGYNPQTFYSDVKNILDKTIKEDRKNIFDLCENLITGKKSEPTLIRRYHKKGYLIWLYVHGHYLKGEGDDHLICLTFTDISYSHFTDQIIEEQSVEIMNSFQRYHTLYENILCGILVISDDNSFRLLSANSEACRIFGYDNELEFCDAIKSYLENKIIPEDKNNFINIIKTFINNPNRNEFENEIVQHNGKTIWIKGFLDTVTYMDGTEIIQIAFVDITKLKETEILTQKAYEITENIFNAAKGGSFKFNINKNKFEYINENLLKLLDYEQEEFIKEVNNNFINMVYEEDVEIVKNEINHLLNDGSSKQFEYRIKKKGGNIISVSNVVSTVTEENGERFYYAFLTEISEEKLMFSSLIHNFPTGLIIYEVNEKVKPLFISDYSYSIFGIDSMAYSKMIEEGFQSDFIYNKIMENVTNDKIMETEESFETVFSTIKADGMPIWIRAIGKFKNEYNGKKLCYVLLVDATDTMKRINIKERENDLFRTLIEDTQTLIFDYDVNKDLMNISIKVSNETNIERKIEKYTQNFYSNSYIHKDFVEEYKIKFFYALQDPVSESNVYLADYHGTGYRWYKENYKSLRDEHGKIYRIVGSAYDITAEKEVKAELVSKAEIDGITGLYNRTTVEKRIDDILKADAYRIFRGDKTKRAFIVFDIDNLKEVNDIEGHFIGDTIIKEFSEVLKDIFNEDAIIGRSGGDEFIIMVNLTDDYDKIEKYMDEVYRKLEDISYKMNFENPVTVSAGIVFAPMYGKKFDVLYSKADKALFQAKNDRKGKYSIYKK